MAYSVPATHLLDKPILQGLQVSSATAAHQVGYQVKSDDGREFTYAYMHSSDVSTYSGAPAVWSLTSGANLHLCVPDCGDNGNNGEGGAGVFTMSNVDVNRCYLWLQTKGFVSSALVSYGVDAGDALFISPEDCFEVPYGETQSTEYSTLGCEIVATALTADGTGITGVHSTANILLL